MKTLVSLSLSECIICKSAVISDISKDVVASVGEDVQFNCTVENVGRMSVSWAKRSVVLSMRNILSLSDPRYTITETRNDEAGSATYSLK
ncbi:unnamed protein product [Ceratitis capitata]|uniref:(Mediterranean fruit fly) hypothetical protein n=1 Tax=Ceratitis capitata TaxID=7213 RepID=A0A811UA61_CERCA|nr:unnamed protein product [Ceratitis capitata]